jgi:hypothetical protein
MDKPKRGQSTRSRSKAGDFRGRDTPHSPNILSGILGFRKSGSPPHTRERVLIQSGRSPENLIAQAVGIPTLSQSTRKDGAPSVLLFRNVLSGMFHYS